jgi:ribosomal protein S18 acetylase RimI-like enzyme
MIASSPEKSVKIRKYRHPADYQAAYHVWETAGKGIRISFSDHIDEIQKLVDKSPGLFFVAESNGQIIGTVMGGFDGRRGLIYHLAVMPNFRNRQVGSILLNRVEEELAKAGCSKIYLFVAPENIELSGYYLQRGYEKMDVIPFTKILEGKKY